MERVKRGMQVGEWLVVDNSLLGDIASCDRKGVLVGWHRLRGKDRAPAMGVGSAIHAGLASYLVDGDQRRAASEVALVYGERVDTAEMDPNSNYQWENVKRLWQAWMDAHPHGSMPFVVTAVEEPFEVELVPGVLLVGVRDARATRNDTGEACLVEHKTTGRVDQGKLDSFDTDSQVSLYLYGDPEGCQTAFVNLVDTSRLPSDATRKCKKHGVPFAECGMHPDHNKSQVKLASRSRVELEEASRVAVALVDRYVAAVHAAPTLAELSMVPATGKFHGECQWCEFRKLCRYGALESMVGDLTVANEWEPVAGRPPGLWVEREVVGG